MFNRSSLFSSSLPSLIWEFRHRELSLELELTWSDIPTSSTTLPLGMPAVSRGRCTAVGRSMIDSPFAWKWRGCRVGIPAFRLDRLGCEGIVSLFLHHIFVVKVQEITWSASYGENKTVKQSNDPLHLVMGQTKTPHPSESNQT